MKFAVVFIVYFLSVAHALHVANLVNRNATEVDGFNATGPVDLGKVSDRKIDFINGPNARAELKCGDNTYLGHDVYVAAQYGVNLKSAGETRGRSGYPESFIHNDSHGVDLGFDPKTCPANDNNRMSYPLKVAGRYDGGKNNKNAGNERVVYYFKPINMGDRRVYYCGIITHTGTQSGGFLKC